jgi:hypothetical protein
MWQQQKRSSRSSSNRSQGSPQKEGSSRSQRNQQKDDSSRSQGSQQKEGISRGPGISQKEGNIRDQGHQKKKAAAVSKKADNKKAAAAAKETVEVETETSISDEYQDLEMDVDNIDPATLVKDDEDQKYFNYLLELKCEVALGERYEKIKMVPDI